MAGSCISPSPSRLLLEAQPNKRNLGIFFGPELRHPNCGDRRPVFSNVSLLLGKQWRVACKLPRHAGRLVEFCFPIREHNFPFGQSLKYFRVGIISITDRHREHQFSQRWLRGNSTKEGHRNYCLPGGSSAAFVNRVRPRKGEQNPTQGK